MARSGTVPSGEKTVVAYAPPQVEKPAVAPREYAAPAPEVKHPTTIKEPTPQISNKQPLKHVMLAQPVSEQPTKEKPAASERTESNAAEKNHENKG